MLTIEETALILGELVTRENEAALSGTLTQHLRARRARLAFERKIRDDVEADLSADLLPLTRPQAG